MVLSPINFLVASSKQVSQYAKVVAFLFLLLCIHSLENQILIKNYLAMRYGIPEWDRGSNSLD